MKTQADFFKSSIQKISLIGNNNLNLKYYQLPTFMPKNTFYNKNFFNSYKKKANKRYYLNNNNKIIPISKINPKMKKNKSLSSTNRQPNRPNTNFYLSNNHIFNSGNMLKSDNLNNINNLKKFNLNIMNKGINNKYSSKTVPKKNTLVKEKIQLDNNQNQNLERIKILNNGNNINNFDNNNITANIFNKNYNIIKNINNYDFKYDFNNGNNSLEKILNEQFSLYQEARHSSNSFDVIAAYGVNTYRGIFRNYNEDRVSIIVNAKNPKKNPNNNNENINNNWPNISFFGIFDGHAGNNVVNI